MSLSVWLIDDDKLQAHFDVCDTPLCELCATALERWQNERIADEQIQREEEEYVLDEYERAEVERDQSGWDNDDLRAGDHSRA